MYGIQLNSVYLRVLPQVNIDGSIYATPMVYANKEAYQNNQPLAYAFDIVERKQKYSEQTGEPMDEYIEIPVKKDISQETIYVGKIENTAQNYLQMVTNAVIDHLVTIQFIADKKNVVVEL